MNRLTQHHERACRVMPGGVNSSTRLNNAIKTPLYVSGGEGCILKGLDGVSYIDMCCAHGAGLLGNAHPAVKEAVKKAVDFGFANSMETIYHTILAEKVCKHIKCADKVRFVGSGSEATMHLIRACRSFTGKKKIIRIEGHFHGYHEMIYIGGQPPKEEFLNNRTKPFVESPGIPEEFAKYIIPVPFNDKEAMEEAFEKHGKDVALVILEPVCYNSGGLKPEPGYLEYLRKITSREGAILFFDEIQSSFKKSIGGAQQDFNVTPDVCTIGKSLGGGLPLTAMCGRSDIMDMFKPVGNTQHSGTFNAHLVPIMTGLAFFNEAEKPDFYPRLEKLGEQLYSGIQRIIDDYDLNMVLMHHGARFNLVLGRKTPPKRYEDTFTHDKKVMLRFIRECFNKGVYYHDYGGGPAHHGFSIQHSEEDIDKVLNVMESALSALKKEGLL
jgi:glutamate-1-semialdehyde 2,1-aminomutase